MNDSACRTFTRELQEGKCMEPQADQTGEIDLNPARALERIDSWLDGFIRLLPNLVVALIFAVIAWFVAKWIGTLINRSAASRDRGNLGTVLGSFARWAVFLFGALIALTIVVPTLSPGDLIAGLGVSSVAIGFAFKDILQNWLAGLLILFRQPFEIGDQIKVDDFEGTVERIESRATLLKTYDGRRVVIPNSDIYTNSVVVLTAFEHSRSQYDIGIGYGDDIQVAREEMLQAMAGVDGIESDPGPEAIVWGLDESWVTIRARWWTKSDRSNVVHTSAEVMTAIKRAMDDKGIDMPYQTHVHLFHDQTEDTDGDRKRQREGWPKSPEGNDPKSRRDADREQPNRETEAAA